MKTKQFLILAGVILTAGCGGSEPHYDTNRAAALDIGRARCELARDCGFLETTVDECVSEFVGAICAQVVCSAAPAASSVDIDVCIGALQALPCAAEEAPAECRSIFE